MNCPNCGRPLAEGEVCNCINEAPVNAQPAAEAPAQEQYYAAPVPPVPEQQYQQPYQPQQNYYAPAPAYVPPRTDYPEGYKPKRKYAAVLLAATLGPYGIHNFYLGNKNKALTQLLICLIGSLFMGLGWIAAYIWAIIDAVELLIDKQDVDANGFKIQTFEEAIVAEKMRAEKEAAEKE